MSDWRGRLHEVFFEADTPAGYGNLTPGTPAGQIAAAFLMVLGYGIIAVPTGIVSVEIAHQFRRGPVSTQACLERASEGHDADAAHCKICAGLTRAEIEPG